MKNLNLFFEDAEFRQMLVVKAKLELTWKEILKLGLNSRVMKGGNNGNI